MLIRKWILHMAKNPGKRLEKTDIRNTDIRQSDFRPEAFAASFQTKRIQNICMLSYALTYKDELTLMVGRNLSWISGSANSFGIPVGA